MRYSRGGIVLLLLTVAGVAPAIGGPPSSRGNDEYAALDRLAAAAKPVVFTFTDTPIAQVFDAVKQASGVEIELKGVPDRKVTIRTGKVALKDALVQLAQAQGVTYEVIGPNKLVVHRKPPKAR